MGRGAMLRWWAGWVAERADWRCDFPLVLNWQSGGLSGDARESRFEVVEGGFPRISAREYIIISKVKI